MGATLTQKMAFFDTSSGRICERSQRIFTESSQRLTTSSTCKKLMQMTVISYSATSAPPAAEEG
jgi:hypothetical protein